MTTGLQVGQGSPFARIMSVASSVPSRVVDNHEMCTWIDSSDEWIQQRTGIVERRWVGEGETVESMAIDASRKAVERAGIDPSELGAVILSTVSYYRQTPSLAVQVAHALGTTAAAYDISAACAGFCYGLVQAEALVRSGAARYALVVGVEALSTMTNLHDRGTAFIFADGAGAVVVGPSAVNGIGPAVWGTDGSRAEVINSPDWRDGLPEGTFPYLHMEGREVFKWATGFIADAAKDVLAASGLSPDELDVFIPHQANNRITDSMLRHLKLPEHVVVARTITHFGNNSAASVPMAMDALLESGEASSGQTALVVGFGAGLAYAGQVVILP